MSVPNKKLKSVVQRSRKPQVKTSWNLMKNKRTDLLFGGSLVVLCSLLGATAWFYYQNRRKLNLLRLF